MPEKQLINRGNVATSVGFGEGLLQAGEANPLIVALGADITASVKVSPFAEKFPRRFYSLGIAEQNCVGVAAGLALSGSYHQQPRPAGRDCATGIAARAVRGSRRPR